MCYIIKGMSQPCSREEAELCKACRYFHMQHTIYTLINNNINNMV